MSLESVREFRERHAEDVLELCRALVAVPSVTGEETAVAEFLAGWLNERGIEAVLQPCRGRFNVVASTGGAPSSPTFLLSGHLDTVPAEAAEWSRDPWDAVREGGRIYGLGATDLKASIAAACYALLYHAERGTSGGRVGMVMTIEEETTGDGTRDFLDWARETGWLDPARTVCVVTEPTGLDRVSLGNKGCGFLSLTCRGLGGHGSRPHLARNPLPVLMAAVDAVTELERRLAAEHPDAELGVSTLTPTAFLAGDDRRRNVIPHAARAVVDCRVTPALFRDDFAAFRAALDEALTPLRADGFELTWQLERARPGHKLERDHPLALLTLDTLREELGIAAEVEYTPAGNDAVFFGEHGIPTVNKVGPGLPACAHRVDEYVEEQRVLEALDLYARLAERHLERA